MSTRLVQLLARVQALEILADEVGALAQRSSKGEDVLVDLNTKGQRWYRGSRELLVSCGSSSVDEFNGC
jgi:hypothetical protein